MCILVDSGHRGRIKCLRSARNCKLVADPAGVLWVAGMTYCREIPECEYTQQRRLSTGAVADNDELSMRREEMVSDV